MELPAVAPVEYRGELVALVSHDRIHVISPWLLERPSGDPDLRFVIFMCLGWAEAFHGRLDGPMTNELAGQWARAALIGPDALESVHDWSDEVAASALNVPVDQLRAARNGGVPVR
jgi:hypothetical protein